MPSQDVEKWAEQTEKLVVDAFHRGIALGRQMAELRPKVVIDELKAQLPAENHVFLDTILKRLQA
jgi:hypothetical protein